MSSQDTASGPSGPHANSDISIEMYLLACGHGDTIFLRLPEDRWVLIDCHLRDRKIRQRFFDFVRRNKIGRLDFIFQTHPDFDHFCGMVHVLNHFTRDGRSIGYWCDGGLNARQVRDLIASDEHSEKEYAKLHDRLDELSDSGLIQTVSVNDWTEPMSPRGYSTKIDLFVVAPSSALLRKTVRADIARLGKKAHSQFESNALSLVLVLSVAVGSSNCNVLLCADTTSDGAIDALRQWKERAGKCGREKGFDAVKVPHHGSIRSHADQLCTARRRGQDVRVAAISAGTRAALPDREVIRMYREEGWVVLVTTTRTRKATSNRLMDIVDRSGPPDCAITQQNVMISWNPKDGLVWEPDSAQVDAESLTLYETKA